MESGTTDWKAQVKKSKEASEAATQQMVSDVSSAQIAADGRVEGSVVVVQAAKAPRASGTLP